MDLKVSPHRSVQQLHPEQSKYKQRQIFQPYPTLQSHQQAAVCSAMGLESASCEGRLFAQN